MAGALRRVSQNYNWTIKRSHNDLHNVIHSQPWTPSHSHAGVGSVDVPLVSWDANRLRWKFGTEYEELREHLEHSFLILLTWAVTVLHLLFIGTRYTITNPICSVIRIRQLALATLLVCSMSMWHLWITLVRSTASLILYLLREILEISLSLDVKAGIGDKTGARSVSWLVGQLDPFRVPVGRPQVPESAVKVHADNASSDLATSHWQPAASFAKTLKDGIETIHTLMQDKVTQLSRRKTPSNNDAEDRYECAKVNGTDATY